MKRLMLTPASYGKVFHEGERNTMSSLTIPEQSMTVQEIILKHQQNCSCDCHVYDEFDSESQCEDDDYICKKTNIQDLTDLDSIRNVKSEVFSKMKKISKDEQDSKRNQSSQESAKDNTGSAQGDSA